MLYLYVKAMMIKESLIDFFDDEGGLGTVEIAVIIIVLIGLALLFQTQIRQTLTTIFANINGGIPAVDTSGN